MIERPKYTATYQFTLSIPLRSVGLTRRRTIGSPARPRYQQAKTTSQSAVKIRLHERVRCSAVFGVLTRPPATEKLPHSGDRSDDEYGHRHSVPGDQRQE